jgi:hypothetical protein
MVSITLGWKLSLKSVDESESLREGFSSTF